jgi:hypothetical protein
VKTFPVQKNDDSPCAVKVKTLFTMKYNMLAFLLNFFTSYFALIELFFLTVWYNFYNSLVVHCFSKRCSKKTCYVTLNTGHSTLNTPICMACS